MKLALKIDVDTYRGTLQGVPRLVEILRRQRAGASFLFSLGPDHTGRAIKRALRPGFMKKVQRTSVVAHYGIKTLMYGTLLPAPLIVPSAPDIFKRAFAEGHDCGVHAWDHVYVQDELAKISRSEFKALFEKAASMFEKLSGARPTSYAAPGWQLSADTLSVQQELGLEFCSDVRGFAPFLPVFKGVRYAPVQVPTTLPTMDEIYGLPGVDDATLPQKWLDGMTNEWNVVTVHAEMEGMSKLGVLERFLTMNEEQGTSFFTLRDYARISQAQPCVIKMGYLTGRAGKLAVQEGN